jgi:hypothetical protein
VFPAPINTGLRHSFFNIFYSGHSQVQTRSWLEIHCHSPKLNWWFCIWFVYCCCRHFSPMS